jgi:transcriptional regulator with XRE-family HTH domain|nr:helix-turn-helix transcriptional regulator [uncultured Carboxylicivirga sp.]
MIIGQKLRELREEKGLLLRQVAAELEVDTAYISKMERGEKNIRKEFIIQLADLYNHNQDELLALWLADKIYDTVKDEAMAFEAIEIAKKYISKEN